MIEIKDELFTLTEIIDFESSFVYLPVTQINQPFTCTDFFTHFCMQGLEETNYFTNNYFDWNSSPYIYSNQNNASMYFNYKNKASMANTNCN